MKEKMLSFFLTFLIFHFILPQVFSLSVGVAPGVVDLGEVENGKEYSFNFYLISDYEKDLAVELSTQNAPPEFYTPAWPRHGYNFDPITASEEKTSTWISFIENPVVLPPEKKLYTLSTGSLVKANKEVTALIKIPENAEPGYHAGYIVPKPITQAQGRGGTALEIITITKIGYVFKVKGEAKRNGKIIGIIHEKDKLKIIFKNTGTLTMSVKVSNVTIYDAYKKKIIASLSSREYKVKPKEITTIAIPWFNETITEGKYPVKATVEWIGGKTEKEGVIEFRKEITEKPIISEIPEKPPLKPTGFPTWMVSIIIIISAFIFYKRKKR